MNKRLKKKTLKKNGLNIKCQNCNCKLVYKDEYHMTYGVCSVNCYMELVGLYYRDFM